MNSQLYCYNKFMSDPHNLRQPQEAFGVAEDLLMKYKYMINTTEVFPYAFRFTGIGSMIDVIIIGSSLIYHNCEYVKVSNEGILLLFGLIWSRLH